MTETLFTSADGTSRKCAQPNFEYFSRKLASARNYRIGYLWEEYRQACQRAGERPYAFSSFSNAFLKWRHKQLKKTSLEWYPGELLQCYWSFLRLRDAEGNTKRYPLFVAVLPYSGYSFICTSASITPLSWVRCCMKAYRFFGGVPHITECPHAENEEKPANLRTNRFTLQAFAEHYRTVLFYPCPKTGKTADVRSKPLALKRHSGAARLVRASLNGSAIEEAQWLDERIAPLVASFNEERKEAFYQLEAPQLLSLPQEDYDMALWSERVVRADYHFPYNYIFYSVPYRFAGQTVRIRATSDVVEAYSMGVRIARHKILKKAVGRGIVTDPAHRPASHRRFADRFEDRFMPLAKDVGPATGAIMKEVLSDCERAGKGYRPCKDLLDLRKMPSGITLEEACTKVLEDGLDMTAAAVRAVMEEGAL